VAETDTATSRKKGKMERKKREKEKKKQREEISHHRLWLDGSRDGKGPPVQKKDRRRATQVERSALCNLHSLRTSDLIA